MRFVNENQPNPKAIVSRLGTRRLHGLIRQCDTLVRYGHKLHRSQSPTSMPGYAHARHLPLRPCRHRGARRLREVPQSANGCKSCSNCSASLSSSSAFGRADRFHFSHETPESAPNFFCRFVSEQKRMEPSRDFCLSSPLH